MPPVTFRRTCTGLVLKKGKHPSDLNVAALCSLPVRCGNAPLFALGDPSAKDRNTKVLSNARTFDARAVRLISPRVRRMYGYKLAVETPPRLLFAADEIRRSNVQAFETAPKRKLGIPVVAQLEFVARAHLQIRRDSDSDGVKLSRHL